MKKYLSFLFCLGLLASTENLMAQSAGQQFTTNGKGNPYREHSASDIEGTPNLYEGWMQGKAVGAKGEVYSGILFKYNIYDDLPLFAHNETDVAETFIEPVKSFMIMDNDKQLFFSNGFPAIDNYNPLSYYQVLADGKTTLLKHHVKVIMENAAYGMTVATKKYTNDAKYYIFKDGKMTPIKANKTFILNTLADKAAQVNTFAKTNSINFKNDEDLGKLFTYYNSL